MAQIDATDVIRGEGKWRPQTVVAASTQGLPPFMVLLTFTDGFRASVTLEDPAADNLGVVLGDEELFRGLFVDPELGTIV